MCRMFAACGILNVNTLIDSIIAMSSGSQFAAQNGWGTKQHDDGWGALFYEVSTKGYRIIKSDHPLRLDPLTKSLRSLNTPLLIVHARSASEKHNVGINFCHPLVSNIKGEQWYFFHNGYAPEAYKLLGRSRSLFDSQELFDYLLNVDNGEISAGSLMARLEKLPSSTVAANFFLVSGSMLFVGCHYSTPSAKAYYTIHFSSTKNSWVYSSEPLPMINADRWIGLENRSVETKAFVWGAGGEHDLGDNDS